jgi:hypothetical protein
MNAGFSPCGMLLPDFSQDQAFFRSLINGCGKCQVIVPEHPKQSHSETTDAASRNQCIQVDATGFSVTW